MIGQNMLDGFVFRLVTLNDRYHCFAESIVIKILYRDYKKLEQYFGLKIIIFFKSRE